MTSEERRGRQILLVQIVLILLATLVVIAYYLSTEGVGRMANSGTRLVLTAALCVWLYRGSIVAKWIVVVVFGVAGILGLANVLSGSAVAFALGGGLAAVYLSSAVVVWRSSSVNAFLRLQGRGGGRDDRAAA